MQKPLQLYPAKESGSVLFFPLIYIKMVIGKSPNCLQLHQNNGHCSGKKQVMLSPIMLLLMATLSLIKITQGYSLKTCSDLLMKDKVF